MLGGMSVSELCVNLHDLVVIDKCVKVFDIFVAYTVTWLERSVAITKYPFEDDVRELISYLRSMYSLDKLKEDPIIRAYRDFFWRIGIDPTKVRPASEALVRRGLRGSFPRINPVVDAGNIASAYTMVPIGMYDLDSVEPPFKITLSRGGEVFRPIGGRDEVLGKNIPILIDSKGIVMHIYPHRDSRDTCISCLLYTSPSPRDLSTSRMPSSA